MGRPRKTQEREDTTVKLGARAIEHFARFGFAQASLAAIAQEANVTRTTLLYHFETKEKLYNAVVHQAFNQIASELVASLAGSGTFRARLKRLISCFLAYIEANPNLAKLMIREVVDEHGPGCDIIVREGLPILELVETFILGEGRVAPDRQPILREILLQITTSVMMKSASGDMRETFWGKNARTGELASLLLEGILGDGPNPERSTSR